MKTRREFLAHAPVLALAAGLAPTTFAASNKLAPARRRPDSPVSLENLRCATFVPLVNSRFKWNTGGASPHDLVLADIQEQPVTSTSDGASLETFSLLFWNPSAEKVRQGTYQLQHPAIGEFSLFIVPVARVPRGQYYEAVFNRIS